MPRENILVRQVHDLITGSAAWHQFRLDHFGASEASAMLGLSSKVKRTELLHMKSTGLAREFSDWVQENILDHGHTVEALARPIKEREIGTDLYPVTCSEGRISASCDGLTLDESCGWEHKQWNEALAAAVVARELPDEYMVQPQQCLMVSRADIWIFTVSDGTEENTVSMEILPDPVWFERIRAGWDQFAKDLADYAPRQLAEKPAAEAIMALPALMVQIRGEVVNSNLPAFKKIADTFIANIKTTLETDQDFADAEATVKFCGDAEKDLEHAKNAAIAQTASIDELMRTVDHIKDQLRVKRLMLEKLVTRRKQEIKETILAEAKSAFVEHVAALDVELSPVRLNALTPDFAGAMKNKRTLASLHDAVDTLLANAKISTNATAADYRAKLAWSREHGAKHQFLLNDLQQIVVKAADDFQLLITSRIDAHERAEAAKVEALRAKIAAEEKAKAESAARQQREADELAERERVAREVKAEADRKAQAAADARAAELPAGATTEIARQASFYGEAQPSSVERLQGLADQNIADKGDMARVEALTGVPMRTRGYSVAGSDLAAVAVDAGEADEAYPTYDDIAGMGTECGLTLLEWVERLERFTVRVRQELLHAA